MDQCLFRPGISESRLDLASGGADGLDAAGKDRARRQMQGKHWGIPELPQPLYLDHAHGHAAINDYIFPGDEVIFHQFQDETCDILRLSFAVQRYPVFCVMCSLLWGQKILERGANNSRGDTVYADIVVCKFACKYAGKLGQCALHDSVGNGSQTPAVTGCRADQDDGSLALLDHVWDSGVSEPVHGMDVDIKGLRPIPIRGVEESTGSRSAGRVNEHIDTPPLGVCLSNGAGTPFSVAGISLNVNGLRAVAPGGLIKHIE